MYEKHYEWSGFSVHPARTGWVVDQWSLVQGTRRRVKLLLPYRESLYKDPDTDLHKEHNELCTIGEFLRIEAWNSNSTQCLFRGDIVQ